MIRTNSMLDGQHLAKLGKVYATNDLRYYVNRHSSGWRLTERQTKDWWDLGRNKSEALAHANWLLSECLGYEN